MLAIYIVTLLVLMGSDILPSKIHAGSSRSSDSSGSSDSSKSTDSKDNGQQQCRDAEAMKEAIEKKIKSLNKNNQPLPACTCGTSGTISQIDTFNADSGKTTTLLTCTGCTGPQVPITSSTDCKNGPHIFQPDLEKFCHIVLQWCKNVTVYRCDCPVASTTEARPTTLSKATSFTEAGPVVTSTPLPTITSVPPSPVTTQGIPVITITPTPILGNPYYGYTVIW